MLELGSKTLLAYFLGSIIGALLMGRLRGGVDIRTLGSGNAGGTNALRTQGVGFAMWVMAIDVGKGLLAVTLLAPLDLSRTLPAEEFLRVDEATIWLQVSCATAVVLGHVFPLWHDFRGGKGAATLLGVLVGLVPAAILPVMAVWFIVVIATGYVGLATMLATATFPIFIVLAGPGSLPLLLFGLTMLMFVCFTHRANIGRMINGTESRARRLWLLRRRG